MKLGHRLKAFRNYVGLTQIQMAEVLGIQQGFLSEVEAGKKMPGSEVLISLKRYAPHISIDWILVGQGKMILEMDVTGQSHGSQPGYGDEGDAGIRLRGGRFPGPPSPRQKDKGRKGQEKAG